MKHFLRFGTYTAIASATLLGIINTQYRLLCFLCVASYLIYAASDTYKTAIEHYEEHRRDYQHSFIYALSHNAFDLGCFLLALIIACYLAFA